ncbi:hypothetical protein AYO40_02380 [Planctomycetaceae bacterium SCGC AG-212-D15]|nr:hypothetical protein AYO40_02380 [Planctomycetaceae bacterium SCGC AG-212-D15]
MANGATETPVREATAYWQRLFRPDTGIFLVLWLILMVGGRQRLLRDPGCFWHTHLGLLVLDNGQLIHGDPFSFTAGPTPAGQAWIPHQWLGESLMGVAHKLGEWDALLLLTVTILAGLYTFVAHRLICSGLHWSLAGSVMILAFAAGSSHFHARPHLSTMVFFAVTFAWLADFEAGRKSLRSLVWLVPMYALWSNLHGGMLGGLVTMGLALAGWTAAKVIGWESPLRCWRQAFMFGLLIAACGSTAFINPYGWRLPAEWLNIMGQTHLTQIIVEHAPLNPTQGDGIMVLTLAAVYLVVLVAACTRQRPRITWLLPLVWLYLACTRIRHASLFGIAAGLAVAEIFPETAWAGAIARSGSDLFDAGRGKAARSPGLAPFLLPGILVASVLGLQMAGVNTPVVGAGWAMPDPESCPLELTERLGQQPDGTRIFNELNFGGYLICFAPKVRVFSDDRCELYGEEFLLTYDAAQRDPQRIPSYLAQFDFDLALTRNGSYFDQYFRDPKHGWVLVGQPTETATLFERSSAAALR